MGIHYGRNSRGEQPAECVRTMPKDHRCRRIWVGQLGNRLAVDCRRPVLSVVALRLVDRTCLLLSL